MFFFRRRFKTPILKCQRGNIAVEFALLAPVVLMLIWGIFEFAQVLRVQNTLQYAVEQTSRYAMVNPTATSGDLTSYATTQLIGMGGGGVSFVADTEDISGTDYAIITANYDYAINIPLLSMGTVTLNARSRAPLID